MDATGDSWPRCRAKALSAREDDDKAVSAPSPCCCWGASIAKPPDQRIGDPLLVMECLAVSWTDARREGEHRLCGGCMRCAWPPNLARIGETPLLARIGETPLRACIGETPFCARIGETPCCLPLAKDGLIRPFGERVRGSVLGVTASVLGRPLVLTGARWVVAEQEPSTSSALRPVAPELMFLSMVTLRSPSCFCGAEPSACLSWGHTAIEPLRQEWAPRDPIRLSA